MRGSVERIIVKNPNALDALVTRQQVRSNTHTHIHTHPFNGPLSGTTRVSWYQKGITNLDFTGARDSEWHWNQLGHMQVCTSLQTDNHASIPPRSILQAGMHFLQPNQQCQSTEGTVLSRRLKQSALLAGSPIKSGSEFQAIGPATENPRRPAGNAVRQAGDGWWNADV